ncbi:MAG: zf-HC2 domain-containing protein [Gemmatimonadota bacterium]
MHLEDGKVQALLHGELAPEEERQAREHTASCTACARRIAYAEAEERTAFAALEALDTAAAPVSADDLISMASAHRPAPAGPAGPSPGRRRVAWRVAAGAVLAVAASGALYALPGSPLRGLLDRLLKGDDGVGVEESAPDGASGVAVSVGESFTISFEGARAGDTVRVEFGAGDALSVMSSGPAAFRSGRDRLDVTADAPTSYRVEIPRGAALVRIQRDGLTLIEARSGTLDPSPATEAPGTWVIPLKPSP